MTTHQLEDVEALADQVIVIAAGSVLAQGSLADLTNESQALQFQAPARLDLHSLQAGLAADYRIQETAPGRYVITGPPTPALLADLTNWCAANSVMATEIRQGSRSLEQIVIDAAQSQP